MNSKTTRFDKERLRSSSRALRMSIPKEQRVHLSELICLHLSKSKVFRDARSIHSFWPMIDRAEVDVRPLILDAFSREIDVWLPIVTGPTLRHGRFSGEHGLEPASFGQLEPIGVTPHERVDPDLVILPGLAIDGTGNRLGFGGGFYDRFLAELHTMPNRCPFVMVLFNEQVVDSVPHLPHDIRVDAFVTEAGMTWCNPQRQSV